MYNIRKCILWTTVALNHNLMIYLLLCAVFLHNKYPKWYAFLSFGPKCCLYPCIRCYSCLRRHLRKIVSIWLHHTVLFPNIVFLYFHIQLEVNSTLHFGSGQTEGYASDPDPDLYLRIWDMHHSLTSNSPDPDQLFISDPRIQICSSLPAALF